MNKTYQMNKKLNYGLKSVVIPLRMMIDGMDLLRALKKRMQTVEQLVSMI